MREQPRAARGEAGRVADRVAQVLARAHGERPDDDSADDDLDDLDDGVADGVAGLAGLFGGADRVPPGGLRRLSHRVLARVPLRIDPGRRAALGVGAAVVLAAVLTGLWLLSSRPAAVPVSARAPQVPGTSLVAPSSPARSRASGAIPATPGSPSATPVAPTVVVVDVAGKVTRPGLYRLPPGSRVDDALRAAGGARPGVDLTTLNLAAPVADGQQVVVGLPAGAGAPAASPVGTTGGGSAPSAPAGPVNLNTATLDQLDALPGVGPVLAQHILDWRSEHGRFARVDQLNDVTGIGDVKFADLKPLVTV